MASNYFVCRHDGDGYDDSQWTAREIVNAIEKGEIEPTMHVVAQVGATEWQQMSRALPNIRDQAGGKGIVDLSQSTDTVKTSKDIYFELIALINEKTKEGESLVKKIDKTFNDNENAHELWAWLG